jgi:hypothetical protein
VISVLVRDKNRVERADVLANILQPFADLLPAQPRVDQDARMPVPDERGVSGTAAGENADPDDEGPPASE